MQHATLTLTAYELVEGSDTLLRSLIGNVQAGAPLELVGEEEFIDLNYNVRKDSTRTMLITVQGDSMCDEIQDGDRVVLALDRMPEPGNIVIARLNGGYTIKRLKLNHGHRRGLYLAYANGTNKTHEIV